jgi:hypothetical protein
VRLPIEEGIDLAFDPGHFSHDQLGIGQCRGIAVSHGILIDAVEQTTDLIIFQYQVFLVRSAVALRLVLFIIFPGTFKLPGFDELLLVALLP